MTDDRAREIYAKAGLGESVTLGSRPAVLVVAPQSTTASTP